MNNTFIWADLSTFDIDAAKQFYQQCFDWRYQGLDEDYLICNAEQLPSAGLFVMPEKFQNIGMPSFWMSYIKVEDLDSKVVAAEKYGARIEVKPQAAPAGGRIALIRDPAGAGFTCYEGGVFGSEENANTSGRMVWNELHISNLEMVKSFYSNVFGWRIEATSHKDRYEIFSSSENSDAIAGIQITSNDIKGDKEYWGVYFSVNDLAKASKCINANGGEIVAMQPLGSRPAQLAYDPQGAAFYITQRKENSHSDHKNPTTTPYKLRAIAGLAAVAIAVLTEAHWIWGFLFLLWIIPDLKSGSTYFFEIVDRRQNPIVYWLIVITWLILSLLIFSDSLINV